MYENVSVSGAPEVPALARNCTEIFAAIASLTAATKTRAAPRSIVASRKTHHGGLRALAATAGHQLRADARRAPPRGCNGMDEGELKDQGESGQHQRRLRT